ncbi:MAG: hypothetical protein Q9188_001925 [Gyalolechia gomerana]
METLNHLLHLPRLPSTEEIISYCQTLRDRLTAELQRLLVSILESQAPYIETLECSCHQPGHCRIVIVTVINDDGTTYMEPTFFNCTCGPVSYDHHKRQIDFLTFDLKDKEQRIRQLMALGEGIRLLLLRHREISKVEIRQEQYWLRQDYARTNLVRELKNREVLKRDPNAAKIPWSKMMSKSDEAPTEEQETYEEDERQLFKVEKEDLWIDEDEYEYDSSLVNESFFSKQSSVADKKDPLNHQKRESSTVTIKTRESSPDTIKTRESSCDTIKEELTQENFAQAITKSEARLETPTTPSQLHLGPKIAIKEVLARFEDIKAKAAEHINRWNEEDTLRADRFTAVHPNKKHSGKCSCTPEQRLYHSYLDAAFDPPRQLRIEAEFQCQIRETDTRKEIQQSMTTDRQEEVDFLIRAIENHIPAQIADLEKVQGVDGRLKALVTYLRRYDGREDLQAPKDDDDGRTRVSASLTFEMLKKVDSTLERWRKEDETCKQGEKVGVKDLMLVDGVGEQCMDLLGVIKSLS